MLDYRRPIGMLDSHRLGGMLDSRRPISMLDSRRLAGRLDFRRLAAMLDSRLTGMLDSRRPDGILSLVLPNRHMGSTLVGFVRSHVHLSAVHPFHLFTFCMCSAFHMAASDLNPS